MQVDDQGGKSWNMDRAGMVSPHGAAVHPGVPKLAVSALGEHSIRARCEVSPMVGPLLARHPRAALHHLRPSHLLHWRPQHDGGKTRSFWNVGRKYLHTIGVFLEWGRVIHHRKEISFLKF